MLYSAPIQRAGFLLAGPFGCYVVYNAVFIWRQYEPGKYDALARYYEMPGLSLLLAAFAVGFALSAWATFRFIPAPVTRPAYPSLSRVSLALMVAVTAALMALTIYRVFGTLSPSVVIEQYARYFRFSRIGGAWIILAAYAILYAFLIDMYFGGVNRWNSSALLVSVMLNFVTGGRMILICVLLAYMFLLYLQRPRYRDLFLGIGAAVTVAVLSFFAVTEMRMPTEEELAGQEKSDEAASHYHLNYNSAFVVNDVLARLEDGRLSPAPHFLIDTAYLVPRAIWPAKPPSTSDTRAVYPQVAERGTTMSFPLSANIVMHVGAWAFVLAPIVAALCHLAFVWGASNRLGLVSFAAFFWGAMFVHIARSGIFDYRIILHTAMIAILFIGYRLAMRGWLGGLWLRSPLPTNSW